MRELTINSPIWLHMGAGNIFRLFVAAMQQDLLDKKHTGRGIIVYEAFDEEIIPAVFTPHYNKTLGVTLHADGTITKKHIASIADAFCCDLPRLCEVIKKPSLQMISLTITENGYATKTICKSPADATTAIEQLTAGLYERYKTDAPPLALVSMDNFAENGTRLRAAVVKIAETWGDTGFVAYAEGLAYPWTMIDKITPRPSEAVAEMLAKDGRAKLPIIKTTKNTFVSKFVNGESAGYLIIEDNFPNGRPPLHLAGAYMTDRETVGKMDAMKVCACLNPLHTILALAGMLLNIPTIAECMKIEPLVNLLRISAAEALPVVEHPGIIDPAVFLEEVLTERFPNPFIPDAPARIATDSSQKIPVRFGVMMKSRIARGLPTAELRAMPMLAALFLRYRMGTDDAGNPLALSPDPLLPQVFEGDDIKAQIAHADTFGVDLYEAGLGAKVEEIYKKLTLPGGVMRTLEEQF